MIDCECRACGSPNTGEPDDNAEVIERAEQAEARIKALTEALQSAELRLDVGFARVGAADEFRADLRKALREHGWGTEESK